MRRICFRTISCMLAVAVIMFAMSQVKPGVVHASTVQTMPDMPGFYANDYYSIRVKEVGTSEWMDVKVFAFSGQSMSRVTADCNLDVEVTRLGGNWNNYLFEPKRYNITPVVNGNILTFVAGPLQKFLIESDSGLLTFAVEPPEINVPGPNDANVVNVADFVSDRTGETEVYSGIANAINYCVSTPGKSIVYFPDGIYRIRSMELSLVDNISFYISAGARLFQDDESWCSNIFRFSGCNNIKIFGRGILDGTFRIHGGRAADGNGWWDGINQTHLSGRKSNGLLVDGVWVIDTGNGGYRVEGANNATFYNTKYVNYSHAQSDNLMVVGGSNILFDQGIGSGGDDSWTLNHTYFGFSSTYNVNVKNSTYTTIPRDDAGGLVYGCGMAAGDVWGVNYENLDLFNIGHSLECWDPPQTGAKFGNFTFNNVRFTSISTRWADTFSGLSGRIIMNNVYFNYNGVNVTGNSANHISDLYFNNLYMNGTHITSAAQGNFTITNADNVHWDIPTPAPYATPSPIPAPTAIPVYSLPISDNFDDGTLNNWTDLSGSLNNFDRIVNVNDPSSADKSIKLDDTNDCGLAGMIKRFTPQDLSKIVTVEMDVKPNQTNAYSNIYIHDRIGTTATGMRFSPNGYMQYFGEKGSSFEPGTYICSYTANTWYHLKWVINVGLAKYDLYVGTGKGVVPQNKTLEGMSFKSQLPNIASVRIDTDTQSLGNFQGANSLNVDNIAISSTGGGTTPTPATPSPTPTPSLTPAPIREYRLNSSDGSVAADATESYNGMVNGTAAWETGYNGNCLNLDGSSTFVNIGKPSIGSGNFTVSAWIRRDTSKEQVIVGQDKSGVQSNQWRFYLTSSSTLGFMMSDSNGSDNGLWSCETTDTIPANIWTHVTVVKNGTNYKLYINGIEKKNKNVTSEITQTSNPQDMLIGARWNSAGTGRELFFDGSIDEVRIYNSAVEPMPVPNREYRLDSLSGTVAVDAINSYNGTVNGIASWVTGYSGSGLGLDGSSTYVNIGRPSIGSSNFTISAWIKRDSTKEQVIVGQDKSGVQANQWRLYLTSINTLGFIMSDSSGSDHGLWSFETTDTIPPSTWTYVAVVKNGVNYKLYINGIEKKSKNVTSEITQASNPVDMLIGARWNSDGTGGLACFDGTIDEVKIYNSAVAITKPIADPIREYKLNSSSGMTAIDATGSYDGTLQGTATWVAGHNSNGLNLDGSSAYVNIGRPSIGNSNFTVSAWIKYDTSREQVIIGQDKVSLQAYQWRLYLSSSNKLGFMTSNGSGYDYGLWQFETTDSIPANTWTYVTVVKDGISYKLYINGAEKASRTVTSEITQTSNSQDMLIGARWNSAGTGRELFFDGIIDDVKILNCALSTSETQNMYNSY